MPISKKFNIFSVANSDMDKSSLRDVYTDDDKEAYMRAALKQAELALDRAEVPVGVIIVHREKGILAEAFNETNVERNGTRHAEMVAFDDILMRQNLPASILEECDLFVTCEVT